MEPTNWINLGMLAATVLAAILAWLGANRSTDEATRSADAASESNEIQSKVLALQQAETERVNRERRKALLIAEQLTVYASTGSARPVFHTYIQIRNVGASTARNITMSIDGKSVSAINEFSIGEEFRRVSVGPNSSIKLAYNRTRDSKDLKFPAQVELIWDDDSGDGNKWSGSVL